MQRIVPFVFILVLTILKGTAQNLISNPSFEAYTACPERNGDIKKCISWSTTSSSSTPDYFNRCFQKGKISGVALGVPQNSEGFKEPVSGDAYVGLAVYFKKSFYTREYIQNSLKEPLEKGKKYKLSFYIALSDSSEFTSDHIGVDFSVMPNGISSFAPEPLLSSRNSLHISIPNSQNNHQWIEVEAEFVARGGEEYMIIGSFRPNMTEKEYRKRLKKNLLNCSNSECAAYYYVDEVFLEELIPETNYPKFR